MYHHGVYGIAIVRTDGTVQGISLPEVRKLMDKRHADGDDIPSEKKETSAPQEQDPVSESLESRVENLTTSLKINVTNILDQMEKLKKEVKDQREDYHAHIRQFVEENGEAHRQMDKSLKALQVGVAEIKKQQSDKP